MPDKKPFKVSARTARLIGRENVSNADGALIELVKNSYDADSPICILFFDINYAYFPEQFDAESFLSLLETSNPDDAKLLLDTYHLTSNGKYIVKTNLPLEQLGAVETFYKSQNKLYIIDGGDGMTEEVIDKHWMTIGTNNKLTDVFTSTGRVKSGAKGIGRFALDRLGSICRMVTFPRGQAVFYKWDVNWEDFERDNVNIGDVNADFETIKNGNYRQEIVRITKSGQIAKILNDKKDYFKNGTLLDIQVLRDWWSKRELDNLFVNLENLSPPAGKQKFKIYLFSNQYKEDFGEVNAEEFNDYDYKVEAEISADRNVTITVHRDEFQYNKVDKELFKRSSMRIYPFDEATFKEKEYIIRTSIDELLPKYAQSELKEEMNQLSAFSFVFYFMKQSASESDKARFSYKNFSRPSRTEWFRKFGGIKIFRDNFRVRPYGETDNTAFDWLLLGDRQAKSPAAITKKGGGWRVGPNQVAGVVNISRLANFKFEDKSSREGFQENETFIIFKDLLLAIIHEFELDRHTVMREMDLLFRQKQEEAEARRRADELLAAEKEKEEQEAAGDGQNKEEQTRADNDESHTGTDYKEERDTYKKAYEAAKSELEDSEDEVRILSALATTGLIVTSFAHEFSSFKVWLDTHTNYLENELEKLLPREELSGKLSRAKNPYIRIEALRNTHAGINQWLNIALAAVRKDKRKSDDVDIKSYLASFEKAWSEVLKTRKATLRVIPLTEASIVIKAYIIDIDSIFNNLLVNSFDAFDVNGFVGDRHIFITVDEYYSEEEEKRYLKIIYRDSGPGLNKKIKNPYLILRRGYTTKVDPEGNENGTGLGMWIVNDAVTFYGGILQINNPNKGFECEILLPLNQSQHE